MKKQIRRGVFETNSSSTHSVCVHANARQTYDTIVPKNGVVCLTGGYFGWEWEKYNDAKTKANYVATAFQHRPHQLLLLETVIKEHTGAKKVKFDFSTEPHIDHQSIGNFDDWFTIARLTDFIFDTAVELRTGNDNSESPWND